MATLTTGLSSYRTLHSVTVINSAPDTDLAAATGYFIGKPSAAVDLWTLDGAGKHLKINSISMIVHTTDGANGDTVTQKLYGAAENGPPQLIASIVWTIGLAQVDATATNLWADQAVVTSTHMKTITVADGAGGGDRICSVTLDLTGYRYILGLWTGDTGDPDLVTTLYRTF